MDQQSLVGANGAPILPSEIAAKMQEEQAKKNAEMLKSRNILLAMNVLSAMLQNGVMPEGNQFASDLRELCLEQINTL